MLIAGGGYADIPLILSAKELDYYVITSGNRPNDMGHRYSDQYEPADFSDRDAILSLAKRLKIDAICPCCNDFSALSCAYTAECCGLPGHDAYETAKLIHHKDLYRDFASAHEIPTPIARSARDIQEALRSLKTLRFPLIVKPVDLTGGKGVSTLDSIAHAEEAVERAFAVSRIKRVVMEEFVVGSRHGFSAFLREGRVVFSFFDNEHYFLNPYLVSAASVPGNVPDAAQRKLRGQAEKIAALLSLGTGIFHVQYILRDGEPVIIEICRRAPGDLYIKLVEHATGVPYASWIVKAFAGLDCGGLAPAEPTGFFTRHCVMSAHPGRVRRVVFDASIERNVIDRLMWWEPGDPVSDVMTSKFGIVFLRFDSQKEMLDKTERMQELIRVEVE